MRNCPPRRIPYKIGLHEKQCANRQYPVSKICSYIFYYIIHMINAYCYILFEIIFFLSVRGFVSNNNLLKLAENAKMTHILVF